MLRRKKKTYLKYSNRRIKAKSLSTWVLRFKMLVNGMLPLILFISGYDCWLIKYLLTVVREAPPIVKPFLFQFTLPLIKRHGGTAAVVPSLMTSNYLRLNFYFLRLFFHFLRTRFEFGYIYIYIYISKIIFEPIIYMMLFKLKLIGI
jgi:hypothetical protein